MKEKKREGRVDGRFPRVLLVEGKYFLRMSCEVRVLGVGIVHEG